MKIIKLLGVLLAGGLILNACASSKDNVEVKTSGENKSEEASKTKKPDYEIKEVKVENDGFAIYVTGVLTNNTDSEKSYVQVSIPAYDESGNKVSDAFANVNNLKAKRTWKFRAMYLGKDKNVTFKAEEAVVSGF